MLGHLRSCIRFLPLFVQSTKNAHAAETTHLYSFSLRNLWHAITAELI